MPSTGTRSTNRRARAYGAKPALADIGNLGYDDLNSDLPPDLFHDDDYTDLNADLREHDRRSNWRDSNQSSSGTSSKTIMAAKSKPNEVIDAFWNEEDITGGIIPEGAGDNAPYSWEDANKGVLLLSAKVHKKEGWKDNPNKRKGSEERQKSGDRERNAGHPDGEEHSRVPKGSGGRAKSSNGPLRADTLDEIGQAILGGVAAVGTGYLIYRGIRILPSLLPPLWWTIPANLVTP